MNPAVTQQTAAGLKDQRLADFIHELNIARRNLSLYPFEHPRIATSHSKALQILLQLLETRGNFNLGVAPEALMLDQQWLDREHRTFQDFARLLFALGVATLSFNRGTTFSELLSLNQLLHSDRETIDACGGFPELLRQQQIAHVEITPIDYSAFQLSADGVAEQTADGKALWENFLQGLLSDSLVADGDRFPWPAQLDPEIVAEVLNQRLSGDPEDTDHNRVIHSFVHKMLQNNQQLPQGKRPIQQLPPLLERLTPELRQSFLNSTFEELDQHLEDAEQALNSFPRELLLETLEQKNRQQLKISTRLVNLVQRLSTAEAPLSDRQTAEEQPLEKDIIRARLDVIFSEEDQDLYMPSDYQFALREILDEDLSKAIPEERKQQFKATLAAEQIERQCCAVIFEMLGGNVSTDAEGSLQKNLVELSRFFLDTGDFVTLREIYRRWAAFLHSDKSTATIFTEQVLANHAQPAFISEVLDGIELWGKEKAPELIDYIAEVGVAYTDPLIERLANEPQRALRRVWMTCLERLGTDANQPIIDALQDERWYLIRNLLIVLGQHPESTSLKAVHQFIDYPHPRVRQEAMRLLFRMNPATANRQLHKELNSGDPDNLQAAAQVADLSQDPAVLAQLHQLLGEELTSEIDLEIKIQLLNCLARIGNETSLTVLQRLLGKKRLLLSRRQKRFQQEIILSLVRFPRRLAEPFLQQLATGGQRSQARLAKEQLAQLSGGAA